MNPKTFSIVLAVLLLAAAGCNSGVNRSLHLGDGEKTDSGFNTVNGSIRIGRDAEVGGSSRTVNGRISVDDGSKVESLATVNGSIKIGDRVEVDGDLETVNGSVTTGQGTKVDGDVSTVNGALRLAGTVVTGKLATYNGAVTLSEGSRVERDVVIERTRGNSRGKPLSIKVTGGSVIEGDVIVKTDKRPVTVVLESGGEVKGEVRNAEVVRQ